jgi:hypothetical protein
MAKAAKKKEEPKKRGKYNEKLQVKGSFMDIITASVKHAEKNSGKKKDP